MKNLNIVLFLLFQFESAHALFFHPNYCHTIIPEANYSGLCRGLILPKNKTRNISRRQLQCGQITKETKRFPQEFDFGKWADLLSEHNRRGRFEAFDYRRSLPDFVIADELDYPLVETWEYQECKLVTSSFYCGSTTVYVGNTPVTTPKTCYADITQAMQLPCSTERLYFDLSYERESLENWNPDLKIYDDLIPNKYDLLNGEIETLKFENFHGFSKLSPTLDPLLTILDPRNNYSFSYDGDAKKVACVQNVDRYIKVKVKTLGRKKETRNPLIFEKPKTVDGMETDPIVWREDYDQEGKVVRSETYPEKLRLMDITSTLMKVYERHLDYLKPEEKKKFWKNTIVRVKLYKKRWWMWDEFISKIYHDDISALKAHHNTLSDDDKVKFSDLWEVPLVDENRISQNLYRRGVIWPLGSLLPNVQFRRHLKPNRTYVLKVSVYQKGFQYYRQSCKESSRPWDCKLFFFPFRRGENYYFSEDLKIEFKTSPKFDQRTSWEKIVDTANVGESFFQWLGRKFTKKK